MNFMKLILILLGTISLCIGIIGIMVPGIPTTPFLLLTAGLYIRSSDRLYNKLTSNMLIGHYISDFQKRKGMTFKSKIISITIMWIMIFLSCYFFIQTFAIQIIVTALGIIGTIVMGFIMPTVKHSKSNN